MDGDVAETDDIPPGYLVVTGLEVFRETRRRLTDDKQLLQYGALDQVIN